MARRKNASPKPPGSAQIIAMLLVGSGLLVLGVAAVFVLPRTNAVADTATRSALPVEVEFAAPELNLTDISGAPVSLRDYRGTVVLVNNWATWCPPCKAEMPALQEYFEAHRHQNFTIIAIESGEPVSEVADFVANYGLTFIVWPDQAQQATEAFRNPALPSSYLVDANGTVRLAWSGAITLDKLEKYVTPLLED